MGVRHSVDFVTAYQVTFICLLMASFTYFQYLKENDDKKLLGMSRYERQAFCIT